MGAYSSVGPLGALIQQVAEGGLLRLIGCGIDVGYIITDDVHLLLMDIQTLNS